MTLARVEIDSNDAISHTLKINGAEVSTYTVGVDVHLRAGGLPNVTLHLIGLSRMDLAAADVVLPTYVTDGLTALGWTPPAGRELVGEPQPSHVAAMRHWIGEVTARQAEWLEGLLLALADGERLCVHEEHLGEYGSYGVRTGAHVLQPLAVCRARQRCSEYGPMTAAIRAQVEALGAEKPRQG